ncbi:MAG: hypothetical protein KC933_35990, partial [Myxococcales bacterium]|nr:hypothetical protein [Myxococcales bacterium]
WDALGLPMNLPPVPPDFDFDAFVAEKLGAARVCKEAGDYSCLKERLAELLARDPINADARVLGAEAERYAQAKAALAQADRHMAKGEFARAYRVLAEIPDDAPQVAEARARAQEIKAQAVEDELARARQDATRRARWPRAHQRYLKVLELEPGSEEAVAGVRELERKMRRKNVEFVPYEPPAAGAGEGSGVTDLKSLNAAILAHYGGDRDLAKVAQAYARGAVAKAKRTAAKLAASGPAKTRRRAAQQEELIGDVERRYARTRTEISNDPDRAWSMLMQLQKREKELLPDSVTSFLCRELEVSLSEAFAERGASMFDRGRFEEAFQGWVSGYKLDSTNPKVRAGLERLERKAETLSQEAELAGQRGDPGACDKWKQVTRITRAETEVHTKARERALALCR